MTEIVLTTESSQRQVEALAGGKGRNLHALARRGIRVPAWAALPSTASRDFVRSRGLDRRIVDALAGLRADALDSVSAQIEAWIVGAEVDAETARAIERAYAHAGGGRVAVRSSGVDEDGATLSFAGQYSSFLNVRDAASAIDHVKRCWASAYSARSLGYRIAHGLPLGIVATAVIVQEMVEAEKSGVAFTANPVTKRHDELMISSVYGLGEGLVSGAVDADTIVIDRATGRVKDALTGEKRTTYVASSDGSGYVVRDVVAAERDRLSLSDAEIDAVRVEAERIEAIFRAPQDIEWAIAGGRVAILQTRPITTVPARRATGKGTRIWDNSNIIESYGDITSPMTFSFARDVYYQTFREHCRQLGLPRAQLAEMDEWLRNMLAHHHGRVYYNLLNWYKITRLAPLWRLRGKMMELSMGTEESLDDETTDSLNPIRTGSRALDIAIEAKSAVLCAYYLLTIDGAVDRFLKNFYELHDAFDRVDYGELTLEETYGKFRQLKRELLGNWGSMIMLEQSILVSVGVLSVMTKKWLPNAPESFFYQMTKPEGDVESLGPARRLNELASAARRDGGISRLIETTPPKEVYHALIASGDPAVQAFLVEVERYIDEFGYRSLNELKLEEPDLREEPGALFSMMKSVISQLDVARAKIGDEDGDAYLDRELSFAGAGWTGRAKGWLYKKTRDKVRRSLAAREQVRFCRTRAFGLARRMIRAMGDDLARTGMLGSNRDIFYLRLEELFGWFDGILSPEELPAIVEMRKRRAVENGKLESPGRFTTHGIVWPEDLAARGFRPKDAPGAPNDGAVDCELRGTPCGPGVAFGEACVVTEPLDVGGKVLVTYRTDPGWCAVLQSASALLIERGSPLTHVAIVARELGVPTVTQIKDLTRKVRTGMHLKVDGSSGIVQAIAAVKPLGTAGDPGKVVVDSEVSA